MTLTTVSIIIGVGLIVLMAGLETTVGFAYATPPRLSDSPGDEDWGVAADRPAPEPSIRSAPRRKWRQPAIARISWR